MTIGEIKHNTRNDLYDAGVTFYSAEDLDDSCQDGYDDIVFQTQCIVKRVPALPWIAQLGYIAFRTDYNIIDYMGTTAIFNNNTNMWLDDSLSIRDFDQLRREWENWTGQPQMWAPLNEKYIAVTPKMVEGSGTFDLLYWAHAPIITSDLQIPLIATDMHVLLEYYMTADMLEQAQEYAKADKWWKDYFNGITEYGVRCKNIARKDLVLSI